MPTTMDFKRTTWVHTIQTKYLTIKCISEVVIGNIACVVPILLGFNWQFQYITQVWSISFECYSFPSDINWTITSNDWSTIQYCTCRKDINCTITPVSYDNRIKGYNKRNKITIVLYRHQLNLIMRRAPHIYC